MMCCTLTLTTARRHSEAIVLGRQAVQRDPESFPARWALGNACRDGGLLDEAVKTYEAMYPTWGRNIWVLAELAITYGQMGKSNEAKALHQEILARQAEQYVQPLMLAISAIGAGDLDAAIGFCQRGANERDPLFPLFNLNYPDLDRLRIDPRFREIVAGFERARHGT
jgi:tetratricopeptide (TPR) repeat protein